jgi:hypothetical protein
MPKSRCGSARRTAERIRNVLAFCVGAPVPLVALLVSGRFLTYLRIDARPIASAPPAAVRGDHQAAEQWYQAFRDRYEAARRLLTTDRPPEPVARAVSLVGEGVCTSDIEERFFYGWRALEVLGHWDLSLARKKAHAGATNAAREYLEATSEPLLQGQNARLDPSRLVEVSLRRRSLVVPDGRISELYALRTSIAHGDVSPEDHLRILKASGEVLGLAHSALAATLESKNLMGEASPG